MTFQKSNLQWEACERMRDKTTPYILDISGKELEEELTKIIKQNPLKHKSWTDKEIMILKKLYGKVDYRTIAKNLEKTYNAVDHKVRCLKAIGEIPN